MVPAFFPYKTVLSMGWGFFKKLQMNYCDPTEVKRITHEAGFNVLLQKRKPVFLFVVLSPKSQKLLRTARSTGSSGSNKLTTSSVFLTEREFGGKTEPAILSLLNILVRMEALSLGGPSATGCWEVGRITVHLPYSCSSSLHPSQTIIRGRLID